MPEILQTRRKLEKRLADEVGAGLSRAEAAAKLIKKRRPSPTSTVWWP